VITSATLRVRGYMSSCPARNEIRARTIDALIATDWAEEPVVCFEKPEWDLPLQRHMALVRSTLESARRAECDLILLLEDDVVFNKYLRHNLESWQPVRTHRPGNHLFASLFNPGVKFIECDPALAVGRARGDSVYGAQALLVSLETVHFFPTCWGACPAMHADIKLARLADLVCPILFHVPSLVQHVGTESLWRGPFLSASDFGSQWRSSSQPLSR
jgi:hypothetical protein